MVSARNAELLLSLEFNLPFDLNFSADALSTKNVEVMCTTLKIIQQLVMASDMVGPALVPFYRQLLPMFNAFKVKNRKFNS